jgi:hypothetical protein
MIPTLNRSTMLAAALCGALLAGCDSIKDVREEPFTELPLATVVLQGEISGLGSRRSIVLMNNGNTGGSRSFLAPVPVAPVQGETLTPFSMGTFPVGSSYNIEIREQPTGKTCTVVNGTGVLDAAAPPLIRIDCENSTARYNLTVALDPTFASAQGARVTLTTEEAVLVATPAAGATSVVFPNALFNPAVNSTNPLLEPVFTWTVTASTTVGETDNKCPVVGPTNSPATQNPTGHINPSGAGNPRVGACSFTISGSVNYSLPASGGTAPPMPAGGLTLELRNVRQEVVATQNVTTYSSGAATNNFTFSNSGVPIQFQSNAGGVYDVAVAAHPTGQFCLVADGGTANLFVTGLTNPVNVTAAGTIVAPATTVTAGTRLNVFCRAVPATAAAALKGTYRLTSQTWKTSPAATGVTIEWDLNPTLHRTASSNMLTFFENGTFLHGTHANVTNVEHGFYQYDPAARTLRFTMHTDTNTSAVFPSGFASNAPSGAAPTTTSTPGLSATPGTVTTGAGATAVRHSGLMSNVTLTPAAAGPPESAATMTGTFMGSIVAATTATATTPVLPTASLDWVLTEPQSVTGQMTGTWVTADSRRSWVFDRDTYYGTHVGVNGAVNMQDVCFSLEDLSASTGRYIRRGTNTGCLAFSRPADGQTYTVGFAEAADLQSPVVAATPGFVGRIPGSANVTDGRSPSPMEFHIAPAATFFASAWPDAFPEVSTSWCNSDMLGIRATLHGVLIDRPVYFCRTRVN